MDLLHIALGYFISAFAGHFFVAWAVDRLWQIAGVKKDDPLRPDPRIRFSHGVAERLLYTTTILLGRPEGIAVWLTFKAVMRIMVNEKDTKHVAGSSIYMFGTALNVLIGTLGALIGCGSFLCVKALLRLQQ